MVGKAPSMPKAPDPVATAQAQGAANKDAAELSQRMSMVDQRTPYGNLTYEPIGDGRYRASVELSPNEQELENLNFLLGRGMGQIGVDQLGRVGSALSKPLNMEALPQGGNVITTSPWELGIDEQRYLAAPKDTQYYADAIVARSSPALERQRQAQQTQLLQRGIAEGSQAWKRSMDDWNRQQNDMLTGAQLAAGQEQSRMVADDLAQTQYQNQQRANQYNEHYRNLAYMQAVEDRKSGMRDAALQEAAYLRQLPINEIIALMDGTQVQLPQFQNTPVVNVGAAPVADSIYNSYTGDMAGYKSQMDARNAKTQGMFNLLGTGAGIGTGLFGMKYSDARLKTGIHRIGGLPSGAGIYRFKYIWGGPEHVGVIAQEIMKIKPEIVHPVGGFLAVDYRGL